MIFPDHLVILPRTEHFKTDRWDDSNAYSIGVAPNWGFMDDGFRLATNRQEVERQYVQIFDARRRHRRA